MLKPLTHHKVLKLNSDVKSYVLEELKSEMTN